MKDQRGSATHGGSDADDPFAELVRLVEQPLFRPAGCVPSPASPSGELRSGRQEPSFAEADTSSFDVPEMAELDDFEDALDIELEPVETIRDERPQALRRGHSATKAADAPEPDGSIEATLRGLSQPARPRDHVPMTQSFAPERQHDPVAAPPTTITLDDFDELIASELAAMRIAPEQSSVSQLSLEPNFIEAEDDVYAEEGSRFSPDTMPPNKTRRAPIRAALLLASVAAIGVAGYVGYDKLSGASLLQQGGSGGPLLIRADMRPFKIPPVDPGGKTIPNQNKAVYERVASNDPLPPPVQQKLVSAEEEPMEIAIDEEEPVDELPGVSLLKEPIVLHEAEGAAPASAGPAAQSESDRLEPHKVRTLVVRPDGTLVAQDEIVDPSAGSDAASKPIETASVEPVPAEANRGGIMDPVAGIPPAMPFGLDSAMPAEPAVPAETSVAGDAPAGGDVPVVNMPDTTVSAEIASIAADAPSESSAGEAPGGPAQSEPQPTEQPQTVASIERPADAPAQTSTLPAGGYFVQISSQPSEAAAQQSLTKLSGRFASAIAGRSVGIQSAAIPGKGTFYRVRIAAATKSEANKVCASVQSAGGSCFVTR